MASGAGATGESEISSQKLLSKLARYILDASDCVELERYEPYVDILRRAFAPSLEHRLRDALEHLGRADPDDDGSAKSSLLCELQAWLESSGAVNGFGFGRDASSLGALLTDSLLVSGRLERIGRQLGALDARCSSRDGEDPLLRGEAAVSSTPAVSEAQPVNTDVPEQSTGDTGNEGTAVAQETTSDENPAEGASQEDQPLPPPNDTADSAATNSHEPELSPARVRLVITEVCENKSRQRVDCLRIPCDPRALERKIFKNSDEQPMDPNIVEKLRKRLNDLCVCLNKLTKQCSRESVGDLVLHCRFRESSLCIKVIRQSSNICMLASRVTLTECTRKRRKFFRLFASKSDPNPCPCNVEICNGGIDEDPDKFPWNEGCESFETTPSGETSTSCDEFLSFDREASRETARTVDESQEALAIEESSHRELSSRAKKRPTARSCPCEVEEINDKFDVVCLSRGCRGGALRPQVVCSCCREQLTPSSASSPTTCTSSDNKEASARPASHSDDVARRPRGSERAEKESKKSADAFASLSAYKQRRKCFKFDPYSLSISRETEDELAICDRMYCEDYPCDDEELVPPCRTPNKKSVGTGGSSEAVDTQRTKRSTKIEYCSGKSGTTTRDKNDKTAVQNEAKEVGAKGVGRKEDDAKDRKDACTSAECLQVASVEVEQRRSEGDDEAEECPELTNIYINEISLCYCSRPDSRRDAATNTDADTEPAEQRPEQSTAVDASTEVAPTESKDCSTQACVKAVLFCACSKSLDNADAGIGAPSSELPAPEQRDSQTMTDPALLLLLELGSSAECPGDPEDWLKEEHEPADHVATIKSKIREIVELNERMREQVARMSASAPVTPGDCCSVAVQTTADCGVQGGVVAPQELQLDEDDRLDECPVASAIAATQTPADEFEVLQRQYSNIMRRSRELHLVSCSESGGDEGGPRRLRLTLSSSSSYRCPGAKDGAAAGDQTREASLHTTCRCSRRANLLEYLSERLSRDGLERLKRLLRALLKKLMEKGQDLRRGWRTRPSSCCRRCCCCSRCTLTKRAAGETRNPCVRCECVRPRGARLAGGAGGDGDHPGSGHLSVRSSRFKTRSSRQQQHRQATGARSSLDLAELEARRSRIRAFASRWAERPRAVQRLDVYEPSVASLPLSRSWRYS